MKIKLSWMQIIGISTVIIILIISSRLIDYWKSGGPGIAYWLGVIITSCLVLGVGILIIIRTVRQKRPRLLHLIGGIVVTTLGVLILLNTLRLIYIGCTAPAC